MNAFAAHFIPAPITSVNAASHLSKALPVYTTIKGSNIVFTVNTTSGSSPEITIHTAAGKTVARLSRVNAGARGGSLVWDFSRAGRGVYFYKVATGGQVFFGSVVTK
jgi:dipeptidyl aminopeptidase/acylaminoacyl peptidase